MTYFLLSLLLFMIAPTVSILWLRSSQYFNFINLYFLLQCLLIIPAAIALVAGGAELHPHVQRALSGPEVESISKFMVLYAIMNVFVLIGLYIASPSARAQRAVHGVLEWPGAPKNTLIFAWALVFLALLMFVWKVTQMGGFSFLFANTSRRVELQAGFGPINIFQEGAFWVALFLSAKLAALKDARKSWVASFLLILGLACLTSTVFGGRKSAIHYILGSLIIISFYRPRFFRMTLANSLRLLGLAFGLLLYFFLVQAYRDTNDIAGFFDDIPDLVERSTESVSEMSMSLSYLDTYLFATQHYESDNRYYGRTYLDLGTAFLPSAFVKKKPPVDDGVYIRSATLGYNPEVGTSASHFNHNSWPPETYGAAMMNFGPWSLPIYGLILGSVLGFALRYLINSRGSDFALLMTVNIFLNFELSNLRIVNLIVFAISTAAFLQMYRTFNSPKKSRRTRQMGFMA